MADLSNRNHRILPEMYRKHNEILRPAYISVKEGTPYIPMDDRK